jgi:hypothetical protein
MSAFDRSQRLSNLSLMYVNGKAVPKLDFLGTISIHDCEYFNVFRRYNNSYDIVLEDMYGDLHFHKDYTLRQSIQTVLCLSEEQMKNIHVLNMFSFKHQSEQVTSELVSMRWSEIQYRWYGMSLNLGGILNEYHSPSISNTISNVPHALKKESQIAYQFNGVKRQRLSDRFAKMEAASQTEEEEEEDVEEEEEDVEEEERMDPHDMTAIDEDDEEIEEDEEEEEEETDYLCLRSGMVYPK